VIVTFVPDGVTWYVFTVALKMTVQSAVIVPVV
jgi:hypothetical protein